MTRGIRNKNAGNIEKGDPWQGLASDQSSDDRFCVFSGEKWGIRAIARILTTYKDKHGLDTIEGIIGRWAPSFENPTDIYAAYIINVLNIMPGEKVDVTDYQIMKAIVEAIIQFENGCQPYSKSTIDAGLRLAGIDVPVKALHKSRTMIASTAATAATLTPLIIEKIDTVKAIIEPIAESTGSEWLKYGLAALTIISLGVIIWARIQDGQTEARA